MNKIVKELSVQPRNAVTNPDRYAAWTDDEMLAEAMQRVQKARLSLIELAEIVGPMYRRGMDLSPLELPDEVLHELRQIESGQVYAPLAEGYMHTRVYENLKRLVLDDQKHAVETGTIGVVVRDGRRFDFRQMKLTALSKSQRRLVFDSGRIRSEAEMITILESEAAEQPDEIEESEICVSLPKMDLFIKKSQRKRFADLKEQAGSVSDLVKRAILAML